MGRGLRLSGKERRTAIVEAVLPLFSKKGFQGATTKELAAAAGVSEALLYRHFPSKEALYEEILTRCSDNSEPDPELEELREMPPGAGRLVAAMQALIRRVSTRADNSFPRLTAAG